LIVKNSDDKRYGFVIGRVRAREATLFDHNRYEQLVACENEEDFLRILTNSPYGEFQKLTGDEILNDATMENFWFLKKYCLDPSVLSLFQYRCDLSNLKLFIKAALVESTLRQEDPTRAATSPELFLLPFGTIPIPMLKEISQAFLEKEISQLTRIKIPDFFQEGIVQAKIVYDATNDPKLLDCAIDKAVLINLRNLAQISQFLYTYFQTMIDLENIRTFFRIRYFSKNESLFMQGYIPGGTIKLAFFLEIFPDPMEMMIERFALTPYSRLIADGVNYLLNNKSFARLERLVSEHLLAYLRQTAFFTFGFEPLVSYFLFKENEIKNLRKILQGLRQKVDKALIRENIAYA